MFIRHCGYGVVLSNVSVSVFVGVLAVADEGGWRGAGCEGDEGVECDEGKVDVEAEAEVDGRLVMVIGIRLVDRAGPRNEE
jgi:hypothetical protein